MGKNSERYEPVRIAGAVAVAETPDGLCVSVDDEEIWLPKSQIHEDSEVYDLKENAAGVLVIPRWLARTKGLTDE